MTNFEPDEAHVVADFPVEVVSAYVEPRDPAATGLIPSCEWFHLPTAWTHRGQISNQSSERPSMNLDRWKLLLPLPLFGLASCAMPAVQNAIPDVAAPAAPAEAALPPVDEDTGSHSCDPNYSGCVPIDSDVDCEGGSGNGPSYTAGPVDVIGTDIYGLDHDADGVGCE